MIEIVCDLEALRKSSDIITENEIDDVIEKLSSTIPIDALGLAAPQIGIHKRVFIASLSIGRSIFINPKITWTGPDRSPSIEACLSIPNVTRCIDRYCQVKIIADKILTIDTDGIQSSTQELRLKDMDACIVQHENDHLDGKLILDHPEVKTKEERLEQKHKDRKNKIALARDKKKIILPSKGSSNKKISAKKLNRMKKQALKMKKADRRARKRREICVEIEERNKAEQEGLFVKGDPETTKPS